MNRAALQGTFRRLFSEMNVYIRLLRDISDFRFRATPAVKGRHKLVESLAIRIYVVWEIFIENLLIDCLHHDASQYASYKEMQLPKSLSRDVCELLLTGIGFLDIKGVGSLKGIANRVIVKECNPFNGIDSEDASMIDEFYIIRNYLAHQSRASKRSLSKEVYGKRHKIARFIEPGEFLAATASRHASSQPIRLRGYIDAFVNAANAMEAYFKSKKILG